MTRNAALTVRLPGARIAPAKSTWTYGHTRLENSGMNGFSRCSIMAGRVRSITSLWRTGDDRTLPLLSHKWIKSSGVDVKIPVDQDVPHPDDLQPRYLRSQCSH